MDIKLIVDAGAMKPGPALSQKLGPAGVNVNQVITKVNDATKAFKGMKVPVTVEVDMDTKELTVVVSSPPASELLKKAVNAEKGSGAASKVKVGNLSIEEIISIARTKHPNLLARTLKSAVKAIVGTCVSLGILIESKSPAEVQQEIDDGKYDSEINSEKTEPSQDKKSELDRYFLDLKTGQDRMIKQEEAAKAVAQENVAKATAKAAAAPAKAPAKGAGVKKAKK
jgi:large subunit ribosomal protein L11